MNCVYSAMEIGNFWPAASRFALSRNHLTKHGIQGFSSVLIIACCKFSLKEVPKTCRLVDCFMIKGNYVRRDDPILLSGMA